MRLLASRGHWHSVVFTFLALANLTYSQSQVTLLPSKDNTLYEDIAGALSNGAGQNFFVGKTNTGSIRRGLIAFTLTGNIPANSTITSVSLTLNMSMTVAGSENVSLHRATADWGEGTSIAPGEGGAGAPATTGDATWTRRFFNTIPWSIPGGDFSPTASATRSVGGNGSYTWASTPALVSDVQGWLNNPSTNFGWVVIGNEAAARTAKRFDTKEHTTAANRPRLVVAYTGALSVGDKTETPATFSLAQNFPNPFNPVTTIGYHLPIRTHVTLRVLNLIGQEVALLVNEVQDPGRKSVVFDGAELTSGMYYYQLSAGAFSQTRKLVLLR
jgi:hypothetical protein